MFFQLHWVDISIVIGYLLMCLALGYSKSNKIKTLTEYAVGSRTISTLALITAVFATRIGAGATMGEIERVYTMGLFFAATLMLSPIFWFITAKIFAGNIDKFKDCISLTDIMRKLYGGSGQWFTVFASIVDSLGSVSAQLMAIGFLFNYLFQLPSYYGIIFAGSLVCAYVTFGGAKSVVLTDIFQFIVFYAAMPIACVLAVKSAGGVDSLIAKLPEHMVTFNLEGTKFWEFASLILYALLPATSATFIQRFLMSRNSEQLGYSLNSIALIAFPFALILCAIGFTIRAVAPEIQSNNAFYYLITHYLPVGVVGFAISAIFAIIMSSANSWLNSGATIVANDLMRALKPNMTDKQGLLYARLATVTITVLSILIAMKGASIMQILWFSDGFWFPVMLIPIIAGMFGLKTRGSTFAFSAVSSVIVVNIVAFIMGDYNTLSVSMGIITSLITFFGYHYFFVAHSNSKIKFASNLFKKVFASVASIFSLKNLKVTHQNTVANSSNYIMFCTFIIYQYIPSMFDSAISESVLFVPIIYIKISVIIFAFILFTFENWSAKTQTKITPALWYFNLFYALCFIPSLMLIVNSDKTLWVINLLLSLVLLIVFLPARLSIHFFIGGLFLAYLASPSFLIEQIQMTPIDFIAQSLPIAYGIIGIVLIFVVKKGLEKKQELLHSNASYVAHEAISPLSLVNMAADTFDHILQNVKSEKGKDYVKVSKKDWKLLSTISDNLASSSKSGIERINAILSSKNNSYSDIGCYQATDITDDIMHEFKGVKLNLQINSNFWIYGSREGIKTVLSNLIRNAIKYAGEHAQITITLNKGNEFIVEDNGFGMTPAIKKEIFKSNITTNGYGYGLTLCKKIIDDHQGTITCHSEIDKGTKFVIRL
jgi:Na+/proline symporter/signal transduction histidine kinase